MWRAFLDWCQSNGRDSDRPSTKLSCTDNTGVHQCSGEERGCEQEHPTARSRVHLRYQYNPFYCPRAVRFSARYFNKNPYKPYIF